MNKQLNCNNRGSKHPALRFTTKTSYLLPVRSIQCRTVITIYCTRNKYYVVMVRWTYLNPPDLEAVLGAGVLEGGMHDVFVSD